MELYFLAREALIYLTGNPFHTRFCASSCVSCPRKLSRFFTAFPKNGTVSLILKSGQFFYSLSTLAFLTSPHIVEARGIGFIPLKSWRPIHGTYAETTNPRTPMYSLLGHCSSRIVLQHNPTIVSGGRFYMYQDRRGGCSRNQYHDQSQYCGQWEFVYSSPPLAFDGGLIPSAKLCFTFQYNHNRSRLMGMDTRDEQYIYPHNFTRIFELSVDSLTNSLWISGLDENKQGVRLLRANAKREYAAVDSFSELQRILRNLYEKPLCHIESHKLVKRPAKTS